MILEYHSSWDIRDSSKLSDYQRCPRYYFYRHLLGWRLDIPAHDLHFGESWHRAREHQLLNGYEDIEGAYAAFEKCYREKFDPSTDPMYSPKNPTGVLNALVKFATERRDDLRENEIVELGGRRLTEIAGTVPISENRVLHYRMDSIMRRKADQMIFSWDHKSTTENYINNQTWANQFFLSLQNGTYTHCLFCQFDIDKVLGIEFCGTGFGYLSRGSSKRPAGYYAALRRVPAWKTPDQMSAWLWTVNNLCDDIERDMDYLDASTEDDPVLCAFPMRDNSCSSYRGCEFFDYCCSWPNPLRQCEEPPLGFVQEFWDPRDREATVVLNLERR